MERLRSFLDAEASGSYCPERARSGWQIAGGVWRGKLEEAKTNAVFASYMNRRSDRWSPWYDPDRPDIRQRNRVFQLDITGVPSDYRERLLRPAGGADLHQLRVLVCEGPVLLAWVGGFREEPFTQREVRRLTALVPALHKRLRIERRLRDAALYRAGLEAALEGLGVPAFIRRPNGSVAHANASGRDAYDASLRAALAGGSAEGYEATPIVVRGAPAAELVVRVAAPGDLSARIASAARDWKLTRRQSEVLALVARGDANKLIAAKLGCALRTVEIHVSNLLRKAGCESRTELVARLAPGGQ